MRKKLDLKKWKVHSTFCQFFWQVVKRIDKMSNEQKNQRSNCFGGVVPMKKVVEILENEMPTEYWPHKQVSLRFFDG
jgi:hypothetical protein